MPGWFLKRIFFAAIVGSLLGFFLSPFSPFKDSKAFATVFYDNSSSTLTATDHLGFGSVSYKLGTLPGSIPNATHLYLFTLDSVNNSGFWSSASQFGVYIGSDPGYPCNPSWFGSTSAVSSTNGFVMIDQSRNTAGCNAGASLSGDFGLYIGGSNVSQWDFAKSGSLPILCLTDNASGTDCAFFQSATSSGFSPIIMSSSTDQIVGYTFQFVFVLLAFGLFCFVAYVVYLITRK